MWQWLDRKKQKRDRANQLREERGKFAVAVIELENKSRHIEELMKRMLEERNRA